MLQMSEVPVYTYLDIPHLHKIYSIQHQYHSVVWEAKQL